MFHQPQRGIARRVIQSRETLQPPGWERCIFHSPGGQFYDKTKPEMCYATPADAIADGCRDHREDDGHAVSARYTKRAMILLVVWAERRFSIYCGLPAQNLHIHVKITSLL